MKLTMTIIPVPVQAKEVSFFKHREENFSSVLCLPINSVFMVLKNSFSVSCLKPELTVGVLFHIFFKHSHSKFLKSF